MRFAIRDDDTNFFTTQAELEQCYNGIWDKYPVTLCVISKVMGNWKQWVHQIYKDKQQTDWTAWEKDSVPHPIEQNKELINFLNKQLHEGKIDIAFHAKYHRNGDNIMPENKSNNYVRGAEFYTNRDLTEYLKDELSHLNKIFNYRISVFTPPQNLLSIQGYRSVINAGLNICGGGITFYKKKKDFAGIQNIIKQLMFKIAHPGEDYPYVLRYTDHSEIVYHYPLQPSTQLEYLINAFNHVKKYDGDFVLSTHYIEFGYPMTYNNKLTMKDVLEQFLDYVSKNNVQTVSLTQLLKNK
jgi:hypothetical protein